MLFSELCKIMVNEVALVGFTGEIALPQEPPLAAAHRIVYQGHAARGATADNVSSLIVQWI